MADTELYDRLGVSRNAPDSEIKKAYHRLARQYHPDKNPGHENKFKEIQEAYEVLSDPDRKATYDRFGMAAVNEEGGSSFGGSMFTESLFSSLFGGDMFGGRRRRSKAETIGIPLEVTLEELYNGTTKSVEYKRKVLCRSCQGTGGKQGSVVQCRKCRGSGTSVSFRPLGPGMVQQIQSMCGDCGGTGDFIREKDRCKKCKGKRVVEVDQKLEVPITPGMRHEQKIPFRGQADQLPDMDAGDVIVILQQLDHMTFQRIEEDLFVKRKISLKEALCGFSQTLDHLDGRKLLLACQPGEVIISPGTTKGIAEEGMPGTRHAELKGNLYIEFDVEFPESGFLEEKDLKKLEALLPSKPDEPVVDNEAEEVDMIDFEGTRGAEGGRKEAYHDSDDDDDEPRGGMGCAHQ